MTVHGDIEYGTSIMLVFWVSAHYQNQFQGDKIDGKCPPGTNCV